MKYTEYIFNIESENEAAADVLVSMLGDCGFESFTENEHQDSAAGIIVKAYIQAEQENAETIEAAVATVREIMGADIAFSNKPAANENWNQKWEEDGFKPVSIGNRLLIHSTRHQDDTSQYEYEIKIDPRLAFGTGTHPTTRMLLTWLLDNDVRGRRVIDAGCGTGILGILAMMRGGKELIAYDIDEWSCDNTRQNFALNNITGEVRLGDSKAVDHETCDLLIANINRNILMAEMEQFGKLVQRDGILLLSGFYQEDIELLVGKAKDNGFSLQSQAENHEWRMLQFRKSS